MNQHKPGAYLAKAVDWGISQTQAGLPQAVICFRYEGGGDLLWFGSFKEKAVERTIETLVLLGLKGAVEDLATGVQGKALDMTKEVEIVVEEKADSTGKPRIGISWVNDPNKSRIKGLSKFEASSMLGGANAILMQKRGKTQNDLPF